MDSKKIYVVIDNKALDITRTMSLIQDKNNPTTSNDLIRDIIQLEKELGDVKTTVNNINVECSKCGACNWFKKCFKGSIDAKVDTKVNAVVKENKFSYV